ncbi:MAG: ABC transporter ATP-binding protein [Proteobacteria bacterium]|nr:ABC transporter ATP-binding protein [Pseudomonadota bacterium]
MNTIPVLNVSSIRKEWISPGREPLVVLKNVNLQIEAGTSTAIVGPSGSGKSTLLSILAGLDTPTTGSVFLNGVNISIMNESNLAEYRGKNLSIVFQQFHLMPSLTAIENVSLPLEIRGDSHATELAKDALRSVGLEERMTHLPKELSGGECQRVAIARAIVTKPSLLLADEPSGNLDPETGEQITNLLFKIAHENKMTMLLVTHNMDLAARCQQTYVMKKGELTRVQAP